MRAFEQSGFKPGDKILIVGPGRIALGMLTIARTAGSSKTFITGLKLAGHYRWDQWKYAGFEGVFS